MSTQSISDQLERAPIAVTTPAEQLRRITENWTLIIPLRFPREELQLVAIGQDSDAFDFISNPTDAAKVLHKILYDN